MPTTIEGTNGIDKVAADAQQDSLPIFGCRAWVNFDGSDASIRGSGNIASVVRDTTGQYTITFTTPMPDANYSVGGLSGGTTGTANAFVCFTAISNTGFSMELRNSSGSAVDRDIVTLVVVR